MPDDDEDRQRPTAPRAMTGGPDMRLVVGNRPENVALVRQALSGLALHVGIEDQLLSDIKTAVSEACNNVVLHAYSEGEGPLEVYVCPDDSQIQIVVRDKGEGIQPHAPQPGGAMQGVGLSLIQALTERVEFVGGAGQGTEVRMSFRSEGDLRTGEEDVAAEDHESPPPPGETVVSVSGTLAGPVLGSVIAVLAARAGFSIERLSDAQLVTDAIAAHGGGLFVGRHVHAGIDTGDHRLELRLGPLVDGGGEALVRSSAVGGLRPVLEQLTDEVSVRSAEGREELRLALADRG
jgi:serine/threonine-protein kinase RsbW